MDEHGKVDPADRAQIRGSDRRPSWHASGQDGREGSTGDLGSKREHAGRLVQAGSHGLLRQQSSQEIQCWRRHAGDARKLQRGGYETINLHRPTT